MAAVSLGAVPPTSYPGLFVAFEGGEGAGKSTQVRLLAAELRGHGHEVVVTFEPGDTEPGRRLREALLHPDGPRLTPRAEALLFAADRAEHVATVVRPALARGAVVVTDRYLDSSIAYQGSGRDLGADEVESLSTWATEGLLPDLTVVLDLPARDGLARVEAPDRLEAEPLDFHERVRSAFLRLASRDPRRYVVLDATADPESVHAQVLAAVTARLEARTPEAARP